MDITTGSDVTDSDLRDIAFRLAAWVLEDAEFCIVYEDDEVIDRRISEEDMKKIHNYITRSMLIFFRDEYLTSTFGDDE